MLQGELGGVRPTQGYSGYLSWERERVEPLQGSGWKRLELAGWQRSAYSPQGSPRIPIHRSCTHAWPRPHPAMPG